MTELYQKVEQFVVDSFTKAGNTSGIKHFKQTVYWVQQLKSDADEALLIAAIAHDIERAFDEERRPPSSEFGERKWDDPVYNKWHSERSAKFTRKFLEKEEAETELIQKVVTLIEQHEFGGNQETDLLRDADSISFLETNAPIFISRISEKLSKNEVREKIDYMFDRIGDPKRKKIARELYNKVIEQLDRVNP